MDHHPGMRDGYYPDQKKYGVSVDEYKYYIGKRATFNTDNYIYQGEVSVINGESIILNNALAAKNCGELNIDWNYSEKMPVGFTVSIKYIQSHYLNQELRND